MHVDLKKIIVFFDEFSPQKMFGYYINIPHYCNQLNLYVYNGNGSMSWWLSNTFQRNQCISIIWEFENTCKAKA
jgi:hypothetical protein